MRTENDSNGYSRKQFLKNAGGALLAGGVMAGTGFPFNGRAKAAVHPNDIMPFKEPDEFNGPVLNRIAADPTAIPPPIKRKKPKEVHLEVTSREVTGPIEDGIKYRFMTFDGQVPGPLLRVRQGDTVYLTHKASPDNVMVHNIDLHAVYGTGGGAADTYVAPGQSQTIKFKAMYPGAFVYHCAVPQVAYHISAGMYGMILVEPEEGLPEVDHEFYLGQHEIYSHKVTAELGPHAFNTSFDFERMMQEDPSYVLLNGEKYALTEERYGPMKVKKGETARIFFANGGPNLTSSFHPIGNVWTKVWREGAIASEPERYVQTCPVAPGSCGIFEMDFPVPSMINLVDHALSRFSQKGMNGQIVVEGEPNPDIYEANPKK